jgi:hypothetical protein
MPPSNHSKLHPSPPEYTTGFPFSCCHLQSHSVVSSGVDASRIYRGGSSESIFVSPPVAVFPTRTSVTSGSTKVSPTNNSLSPPSVNSSITLDHGIPRKRKHDPEERVVTEGKDKSRLESQFASLSRAREDMESPGPPTWTPIFPRFSGPSWSFRPARMPILPRLTEDNVRQHLMALAPRTKPRPASATRDDGERMHSRWKDISCAHVPTSLFNAIGSTTQQRLTTIPESEYNRNESLVSEHDSEEALTQIMEDDDLIDRSLEEGMEHEDEKKYDEALVSAGAEVGTPERPGCRDLPRLSPMYADTAPCKREFVFPDDFLASATNVDTGPSRRISENYWGEKSRLFSDDSIACDQSVVSELVVHSMVINDNDNGTGSKTSSDSGQSVSGKSSSPCPCHPRQRRSSMLINKHDRTGSVSHNSESDPPDSRSDSSERDGGPLEIDGDSDSDENGFLSIDRSGFRQVVDDILADMGRSHIGWAPGALDTLQALAEDFSVNELKSMAPLVYSLFLVLKTYSFGRGLHAPQWRYH